MSHKSFLLANEKQMSHNSFCDWLKYLSESWWRQMKIMKNKFFIYRKKIMYNLQMGCDSFWLASEK